LERVQAKSRAAPARSRPASGGEACLIEFEWSEAKRLSNFEKHGLDFAEIDAVFESDHLIEEARTVGEEFRHLVIGLVEGRCVAVIITRRGEVIRVISMRKARRNERRRYQAVFG
jgi:hypothetical protein